ncbi:MAG: DUF2062 domain-containing protein [Firmicutes bacterium]|nr:DUF2062 domain-containing protein [Bacillota bacterium]
MSVPSTLLMIPVYNHGATLRGVVEGALEQGFDVLVVDDGSTDGGLERLADLPVRRIVLAENQGKGAALRAGAELARDEGFEALLTVDADGQHDPADAPLLVAKASEAWPCLVIGARRMDGPNIPASSRFGRAFSNFWVRLECGQSLPDTQSGYRLYPVRLLTDTNFLTRRYTFEIEALVRGAWAGLPVHSVPVSVHYAPGKERISHFRAFRDNARLTVLHTALVTRSLLPWPHRRRFGAEADRISPLRHPLRFLRHLSLENTSPLELAVAVAVGIFIGALPIIPFGLVTIAYVCHRLKLNVLAAAAASNVCIAPFVPFLCIQIGHRLLHGHWWITFTRQTLLNEMHHRLWEWLLGAFVLGPLLSLAGAALTYGLVRAFRGRSDDFRPL